MGLPKKIYVKEEQDGDETFLLCSEKPEDISEENDTIIAGEYKLIRTVSLVNKTEVIDNRRKQLCQKL